MKGDTTDSLKNKTVLVCGGCGFMGANFIHFLFKNVPRITLINLDLLTYAGNKENLTNLPERVYRFVKGDITDQKLVARLMKDVDFVVNFAAETHVDRSIHQGTAPFIHTNIEGVYTLLETLRSSPSVKKMVHISTDEVWGDLPLNSNARFNEASPFRPNSPYAASKAAGDLLIRAAVKTHGAPVIVSHSVNNFGPRQFLEKLIPFFALRAMKNEPLPLYGDGRNVRDWLFVDDHSSAILTLLEKGTVGEVYAISQGEEYSNLEIAKKILQILRKPESLLTFVKDRPAHDRRYGVDSSKLRTLGWKPQYSLGEKLTETLHWYRKNKAWVAGVVRRNKAINSHITI